MRSRKRILSDLVHLNGRLSDLTSEISHYPWDVNEAVLVINKFDLSNILKRAITKDITYKELEEWANMIECRDDIGFENNKLQEIIFELANPVLNGKTTTERLYEIIRYLL